jgi:hypothetical protein
MIVVELKCKLVVDGITGKLNIQFECEAILQICKASLFSLPNVRIDLMERLINNIIHLLAKASLSFISHHLFDYINIVE